MSEIDKRKELRDQQLKELFENNFDCYADNKIRTEDGFEIIKAMTMGKFIELADTIEMMLNLTKGLNPFVEILENNSTFEFFDIGKFKDEWLKLQTEDILVISGTPYYKDRHFIGVDLASGKDQSVNEIDDKNIYIIGCDTGLGESKSIMSRIDKEKGTCEIIDGRLNKIVEPEPFILRNLNIPLNMTVNEPKHNHKRKPSKY